MNVAEASRQFQFALESERAMRTHFAGVLSTEDVLAESGREVDEARRVLERSWTDATLAQIEAAHDLPADPQPEAQEDPSFEMGKPTVNEHGYNCCGKPQGCTNMDPGCAYLQHPYKRWLRSVTEQEER